jgi:hypothetical protein
MTTLNNLATPVKNAVPQAKKSLSLKPPQSTKAIEQKIDCLEANEEENPRNKLRSAQKKK